MVASRRDGPTATARSHHEHQVPQKVRVPRRAPGGDQTRSARTRCRQTDRDSSETWRIHRPLAGDHPPRRRRRVRSRGLDERPDPLPATDTRGMRLRFSSRRRSGDSLSATTETQGSSRSSATLMTPHASDRPKEKRHRFPQTGPKEKRHRFTLKREATPIPPPTTRTTSTGSPPRARSASSSTSMSWRRTPGTPSVRVASTLTRWARNWRAG